MKLPIMHIIEDNILNAKEPLIAHCCNTRNTMGAGVALTLRTRFPEIYQNDTEEHRTLGPDLLLGRTMIVPITTRAKDTNIKYIANMYAQPTYGNQGRHVNYEALYKCLERLADSCIGMNIESIGLPYNFACNRAGGDWHVVQAMIDSTFGNTNIKITLYEL